MTAVAERLRPGAPERATSAMRDQAVVLAGQLGAGAGTMAFSLVMARLLAPGTYAQLASFLALYLVLGLPAPAITAAAAVAPRRLARIAPALLLGGTGLGAALAVASPWVGPVLRLPVAMVVVLGLSGPALGALALERGCLYGWRLHGRLVATLLAEPAVRLGLGVVLAMLIGVAGAAVGVALGGYVALEIARRHRRGRRLRHGVTRSAPGDLAVDADPAARWTALAFMGLVVVQNQDLLIANRLLPPSVAGQFAVLSTLGGLAAFATFTIPLVLLPRTTVGQSRGGLTSGLAPALGLTALIGTGTVALSAVASKPIVVALFGARYAPVAGILIVYMAAMALLGLARVLLAYRCVTSSGRSSVALVVATIAVQATLIARYGHGARSVALSTAASIGALTVALAATEVARMPVVRFRLGELRESLSQPAAIAVAASFVIGLAIRFVVPRGLWLDEATSVYQARLPFGAMLRDLRTTDVHPPLYFAGLWATVRWIGSGDLAVRLPSILAGSLVIPMLYLLGREAYDRRTGVVAAAAGSVAPIMVWYSQEARMYALLMLFGVVAMWAQLRAIRRGGVYPWVLYTAASAAMIWTQYFGALQVVVQQVAFVAVLWQRWRRGDRVRPLLVGWGVSAAAIGVALVPLSSFALEQFLVNQTAGKGFGAPQAVRSAASLSNNHLGIYAAIANLIWAIWGYHSNATMALLAALWPLGMLFTLALLGRRPQRVTSLLVGAVAVPGVAMFVLGTFKQNLFDIRYLSTAVPVLFVLIARLVSGIPRRQWVIGLCGLGLTASLTVGLADQQYNGSNPRTYDFRSAMHAIDAQVNPGDVVVCDPLDLRQVLQYYGRGIAVEPLTGNPPAPGGGRTVFVVASATLMNGQDPATLGRALANLRSQNGGQGARPRHFPNVEVWVFR